MTFHSRITNELYFGTLPDWQKRPIDLLIAEGRVRGRSDRDIAYVLATAHHETSRFRRMEEYGRGRGKAYGNIVWLFDGKGVTYHGRGYVQITWLENYARMSMIVGRNLVSNPDLAAEHDIAAKIIWEGMIRGTFTGRSLADFTDFRLARQIVNGMDRAELIAGYAESFLDALKQEN